jgi:hypothetical protein
MSFVNRRCVKCATSVQKESSSEISVEDFPKNQIGQLMNPVTRQVFPLFQPAIRLSQPAIPLSQQELRLQLDSFRSLQAQWSELASSQA